MKDYPSPGEVMGNPDLYDEIKEKYGDTIERIHLILRFEGRPLTGGELYMRLPSRDTNVGLTVYQSCLVLMAEGKIRRKTNDKGWWIYEVIKQ